MSMDVPPPPPPRPPVATPVCGDLGTWARDWLCFSRVSLEVDRLTGRSTARVPTALLPPTVTRVDVLAVTGLPIPESGRGTLGNSYSTPAVGSGTCGPVYVRVFWDGESIGATEPRSVRARRRRALRAAGGARRARTIASHATP
jgi:hypothetical protein